MLLIAMEHRVQISKAASTDTGTQHTMLRSGVQKSRLTSSQ